jgi:hypothetical protein
VSRGPESDVFAIAAPARPEHTRRVTDHDETSPRFRLETWTLLAADMIGYARSVTGLDAVATAELLDRHYVAVLPAERRDAWIADPTSSTYRRSARE